MSFSNPILSRLIRQGESETLEFKQTFGREVIETVCAFANSHGGAVLIGIDDRGAVKGVQAGRNVLTDWANQISQGTGLHPSVPTGRMKGEGGVRILVHESRIKPVLFHGKAYKRSGSTTRQMNVEEITRVALASTGITWDEVPEVRATLADISLEKFRTFVRLANETGRRPIPGR